MLLSHWPIYLSVHRVDLIKPVSNVRPSMHTYLPPSVRPSVRPQTVFFDFNEIWHVGRG